MRHIVYENPFFTLEMDEQSAILYCPKNTEERIALAWPQFEIEGKQSGSPAGMEKTGDMQLNESIRELSFAGSLDCGAQLAMELRVSEHTPIVRFRYILFSSEDMRLTKTNGENLTYFAYASDKTQRIEVRLSNYDRLNHVYSINEIPAFVYEDDLMGPILTEQRGKVCMLTAYEHGSMYPDKFIIFEQDEDKIVLRAKRGNYWHNQSISERSFDTVWLEIGAVVGSQDDLARAYREFQLKYCSLNAESRKPYVFYNSWCYQERNRFYNKQAYLSSMKQERFEEEIEIAHKMGIDVFVIDTGWYKKTGDWETNREFFPDGMEKIHEKLEKYGMKLGLWFNPTVAAKTSRILRQHPEGMASVGGKEPVPFPIWETEESYNMCLVSDYWEAFADELIRLADTVGVRYFKWDGIGMYDCDRGDHLHGNADTPAEESRDCYAFRMVLYMSKIIDKLCKAHPDAIVDFDVTEGMRSFGLAFLSSGKYFAINNGPYYQDYDITVPEDVWTNIFVQPGPARTWICRQNLNYDKWIPSVLFMNHYLPDDPVSSQLVNVASLILGQNGIWGDLPAISEEGVVFIRSVLDVYKRVRDEITAASPVTLGKPGELLEVHEKIDSATGRGAVVLFGHGDIPFTYRVQNAKLAKKVTAFGDVKLKRENGAAYAEASFANSNAAILFFE